MKKIGAFLSILLIAFTAHAAIDWEIPNNIMKMGDGSNTSLKSFEMRMGLGASNPILSSADGTEMNVNIPFRTQGNLTIGDGSATARSITVDRGGSNPFMKWDEAGSAWVFSNDGTIEKKIGSGTGGGGGQNFFAESSFDGESSTIGWTAVGTATITTTAVTPINGTNSLVCDNNAQNDSCRTIEIIVPEFFKGKSCEVNFRYTGGTDDLVKPQVLDSSNVKLEGWTYRNQLPTRTDFLQAQTGIVQRSIFGVCPTTGNIKFELLQTEVGDSALIKFDDVHIGELIGLVESVVPDVFSFETTNTGSACTVQNNTNGLVSCSYVGTGTVEVNLSLLGLTENVNCTATVVSTAGRITVALATFTSTSFRVNVMDDTTAVNGSVRYVCQKQGVDAQQTVQVYNSIPKVAENINVFSATITGTALISTKNADWIASVTGGSGSTAINFKSGLFSFAPSCTLTPTITSNLEYNAHFRSLSTSLAEVRTLDGTGLAAVTFHIVCQKQESDFKLPMVQPVIVGQVTNSYAESTSGNWRTESCKVSNTGTPSTSEPECDTWVDSISDLGVGYSRLEFKTGIFSGVAFCQVNNNLPNLDRLCKSGNSTSTTAEVYCGDSNDPPLNEDRDFYITCSGAR